MRMLSVWYDQQRMHVKWKEKLSDVFKMSNGVRQGSVLSPGLFNVYMNDMIEKLQSSGYGARIMLDVLHTLMTYHCYRPHGVACRECWILAPYLLRKMVWFSIVGKVYVQFLLKIDVRHW